MSNVPLYDSDFYAWTEQQAALLRDGRVAEADLANIAEEIASMGRIERRELVNRLAMLLLHLLKWQYQPSLRGNSWRLSVREQRLRVAKHLKDNPSLRASLPAAIADAYEFALVAAERETGLPEATFPAACAWTFDQLMAETFWPE